MSVRLTKPSAGVKFAPTCLKTRSPALGFVNRTDIRQYQGTGAHLTRYRNMFLNQLEFGTDYLFITDFENRLESRENDIYARALATQGDEVYFRPINSYENVPV